MNLYIIKQRQLIMAVYRALERGNPFVEPDRISIEDAINNGHKVFRVRTRVMLHVEEISGEAGGDYWDWSTFYFSHTNFDHMSTYEFENQCVDVLIDQYYAGQEENGIVDHFMHTLTIHSVEKYDNNNINDLPLLGESYRVKMLKNIQDVDLKSTTNQCFWKYFCYKILGSPGFEKYTYRQLWDEVFPGKDFEPDGGVFFTMNRLEWWIKQPQPKSQYHKNVSLYAWWANNGLAYSFQSNNPNKNTVALNFIITDQHILPVEHDKLFTAHTLKKLSKLTKNLKQAEAEINWKFDYHLNNYVYVDHDTFDKNKDAILAGTYKPDVEALIFEIKRDKKNPQNEITLVKIGNDVMHHTKHKLYYANIKRNMFKHPTSKNHQNYIFCTDFNKRKQACDILFNKTHIINFKFNNQSWGEISRILMDYYMDNNEKWQSAFHPKLRKLVDELCCKPLVQGLCDDPGDCLVWDIIKCYTMAILIGLKDKLIPIYHLGDSAQVFDVTKHVWPIPKKPKWKLPVYQKKRGYNKSKINRNGKLKPYLFYIPTIVLKPYELIIREGIYPHILIQHLLDEKHITFDDIKYVIPCMRFIDGNKLVEFVKKVYNLLKEEPSLAKMIINVAVGMFNTKFENKTDEVMISTSPPFTIAYQDWLLNQNKPNLKIKFYGDDNIDWIRTTTQKRKTKDNGVINQYVVASGLVRTLTMLKKKWCDGMHLVGIKTDAIYLHMDVMDDTFDRAVEKDPIVMYYNHIWIDLNKVHPKFYDQVSKQLDEKCTNRDLEIVIPEIGEITLDVIQKYPYKIESGHKPPKYFPQRIKNLKDTIDDVLDKSEIVLKDLDAIDEEYFINVIERIEKHIDNIDYVLPIVKNLFNILIYGTAGSGKTTLGIRIKKILLKLASHLDQHVITTSFQRTCVTNWIQKEFDTKQDIDCKDNWNWDHFYGNVLNEDTGLIKRVQGCKIKPNKIFAIIIDEFFQMPERCLLDLCDLMDINPNIIIIPIGDYNQMSAIESAKYNWLDCDIIKNFVQNKLHKQYIPESGRFSPEVLKLVRWLEKGDKESFRKFIKYVTQKDEDGNYIFENNDLNKTKWHLCKYRKKKFHLGVIQINQKLCKKIKKGDFVICDRKFDTKEVDKNNKFVIKNKKHQKVQLLTGEKKQVLQIKDAKCKLEINDYGKIKYGWFPITYKNKNNKNIVVLSPAYASTTFREQGREILEPYTIHNVAEMSRQELIVAISRGKCKKGILFKFSNLDHLTQRSGFLDTYKDQNKYKTIPSKYSAYSIYDIDRPLCNIFQQNLLYDIVDDDHGRYIGEHVWDKRLTLNENLDVRMKQHLDDKVPKNKLSPVLKMNNPTIHPFYDDDEYPYFIFGKYEQILKIEENHIRMVMIQCKKNGKKYFNRAGTKQKPNVEQKQIKTVDTFVHEIQRLSEKFTIELDDHPTKKNPNRKVNVIYSRSLATVLGYKGKKVRSKNKNKLFDMKCKGIAKMCMVSVEKVKQVLEK